MTPTEIQSAILDIAADAADMPSSELVARISDLVREARAAEREECAASLSLIRSVYETTGFPSKVAAIELASEAIRRRVAPS